VIDLGSGAYGPADFAQDIPVSRETLNSLMRYAAMLSEWQTRINLVGPSTLPDVWRRHFLDSAQLAALADSFESTVWLDMGSGAGFPGVILALLGARDVHLVESVTKKARFLEAVVEALGLSSRSWVHNLRIETLQIEPVDVITARACASVSQLFDWGHRFAAQETRWILPKGQDVTRELDEAAKRWRFDLRLHPSRSDPRGQIVDAWHVERL
jgi:16S rRNA (guanine527-N7)-methyltransferase